MTEKSIILLGCIATIAIACIASGSAWPLVFLIFIMLASYE